MPAVTASGLPKGSFTFSASPANPAPGDIAAANELIDKTKLFMTDLIKAASGYEQIIIGAGYAGFLTVWSQTAPHLSRNSVLASGLLIGISLFAFVSFHVLQITVRSVGAMKSLSEAQKHKEPLAQLQAMVASQEKVARGAAIVLAIWPWVFGVSVLTGFGSAALTIGSAFWAVVESAKP